MRLIQQRTNQQQAQILYINYSFMISMIPGRASFMTCINHLLEIAPSIGGLCLYS